MTEEDNNTTVNPSMSVRLDEDVRALMAQAIAMATGKPVHGLKSAFSNEALRRYLPTIIKPKTRKA